MEPQPGPEAASPARREPASLAGATRCGARTRAGHPCRAPAVKGKRRPTPPKQPLRLRRPVCRRHGGAEGSGAPRGNQNALKHGFYSRAAKAERRRLRALISEMERSLKRLE
jgi:hypothetical protein